MVVLRSTPKHISLNHRCPDYCYLGSTPLYLSRFCLVLIRSLGQDNVHWFWVSITVHTTGLLEHTSSNMYVNTIYCWNSSLMFTFCVLQFFLIYSLKRLGTDYIDIYQLHWPDRYAKLWHGIFCVLNVVQVFLITKSSKYVYGPLTL